SLDSHGVIDRRTGLLTANFGSTPPGIENAFSSFGRHMGKYQPFRFDPATNNGRPFSARDFYSKPAFHDLDIYQEVYRPMGYVDHCFMHIPTGPGTIVFVGFLRDGKPFDQGEKDLLEELQPHLSNARKLALAVSSTQDISVTPEIFAQAGFTPRECDVIFWLTRGKSNDEIASLLHIRADSVSRHLQTIYEKMGVDHRVAATLHALELAKQFHTEFLATQGGEVSLVVATR
ncbi:MAG TPA: LuxR C-terminal-related transcriptional regulator, partial [Chthoniobacterales bacterium]|nr:LuxR C-terminal-related transcriptional regulator [Chthoniobacterales bacterium]